MELEFFFDTYALIEIIKGGKNYYPYSKCKIKTSRLNLMELHYILLRDFGKEIANKYYNFFLPSIIPLNDESIKIASAMKLKMRKKKVSHVDCIGYYLAKMYGLKFLTGDKEFENLQNVEFVK
ncbi:MAG: PIN domain-containing protein [Nanoarchaeota archaeon]|jgi:predicted nucleic acid-binding protein|nr:PIN domain-containing protein [Nanoarchaeota archaeon]